MKGQSIFINSYAVVDNINYLRVKTDSEQEFLFILDLYKEYGFDEAKAALNSSPFQHSDLKDFTGKEALLIDGWKTILSCIPVRGSDKWVIVFKDNPDQAVMYDYTGYNADCRIYKVRNPVKPSKPTKGNNSKKSVPNLMTESDFPIQEARGLIR